MNYLDRGRPGTVEIGAMPDEQLAPDRSAPRFITYFVKDNGVGIPDDYRGKLFRVFQRLHPELASGEGMGLATVHRIVERHGGRIWLESRVGVGTTFFVSLPAGDHSQLPCGSAASKPRAPKTVEQGRSVCPANL